ncbi:flagellin N-terminal helical domain-containing protein [Pelagibacterium xiamenense]|uniref:flagellin N-terminal helical domain-containing protein n=1 Tax=Pelagibacterium xiamenense TaxID=2901140 RepID=UPI001E3DD360|nr:hypothetical protein [Pelagibacterium xiamenense]MCD7060030.1 hypothetical protein [Pelagibacterium xiamenense]
MTTIVNKSFYAQSSNMTTIANMQKQMENLQQQLATGKRYNTLASLGLDRVHDLNIRRRLQRIEGYQANILTTETRLSFYNNSLERLEEIEAEARALAVPNAYGSDGTVLVNAQQQAENLLREVVDLLNTDITGQYIFGGNASDTKPVSAYDMIMNGAGGKAGFLDVMAERNAADTANNGRLDNTLAGQTVSLTEDGDHVFGFKLSSITGGGAYATVTDIAAAHDPDAPVANTVSVEFTDISALEAGDEITIGLSYPDDRGRVEYITLKATDENPPPSGSYLIGADEAETAANFQTALQAKLDELVPTSLESASTYAAADNFFNASGAPVMRYDAGPPEALVADTNYDNTVRWYNGQDSTNPRKTVTTNVDESTKVNYGVQANEYGLNELVKGLAVFAASSFTPVDETNAARYEGMVDIQRGRLSEDNNANPGSIEVIMMELGLANSTMNTVKERHTQYDAQLQTMLADIESAPEEEVAAKILTLQTRLQASYQVTSMVSQLTLVNYLR